MASETAPAATPETVEQSRERATFIYIGRVRDRKKKIMHAYREVIGDDRTNLPPERSEKYWKKKINFGQPGQLFTVEVERKSDDGLSVYNGTSQFVAFWPDRDAVVELQAKDDAVAAAIDAERKSESDYVLEQLEPIKSAMRKMRPPERAAFFAKIVRELTTGVDRKRAFSDGD